MWQCINKKGHILLKKKKNKQKNLLQALTIKTINEYINILNVSYKH